jgi:hypothetical protein
MRLSWVLWLLAAIVLFAALFTIRFVSTPTATTNGYGVGSDPSIFESSRKNYASAKAVMPTGPAGQSVGDAQKFEKVATLTEQSSAFDADREKIDAAIGAHRGIVQFEKASGLKGKRIAYLGIGVPPEAFDAFVAAVQAIGRNAIVEVIKNDKTNEYLQLRAQRTTLEKARAGLEALQGAGGSIDERLNVQARLTDIEKQIQELGVSLGEFDSQNELCTVKLTLEEMGAPKTRSLRARTMDALEWASIRYAMIGAGFFALVLGGWLVMLLLRAATGLAAAQRAENR